MKKTVSWLSTYRTKATESAKKPVSRAESKQISDAILAAARVVRRFGSALPKPTETKTVRFAPRTKRIAFVEEEAH